MPEIFNGSQQEDIRMKQSISLVFAVVLLLAQAVAAQTEGKLLFTSKGCGACHTIGKGRLVGPDLKGISNRRKNEWLVKFIKSPKSLIDAGDTTAATLLEEYNQVMMPDSGLNEAEINSIIAYIDQESAGKKSTAEAAAPIKKQRVRKPSKKNIARGRDFFQGKIRFVNGGASCISCHHVKNDAVIGGGVLAKELTTVFSRLGAPGVRAIIGSPPFPVMQQAYMGQALTEDEVHSLVAFLQHADETHSLQQPFDYGVRLLSAGFIGSLLLLGFYSLVGARRKRKTVYDSIHRRQTKSE